MILLSMKECRFSEEDLIKIKGKIGKILDIYCIEVYLIEKDDIKYYEFFYHNYAHLSFFIKQSTEITEQEIINSFKEMLALLKNPIEKKKITDDSIKRGQPDDEDECNFIRLSVNRYEKHIEKFILEAEGIKKSQRNAIKGFIDIIC